MEERINFSFHLIFLTPIDRFRRPPPEEVKKRGFLSAASALRSRARGQSHEPSQFQQREEYKSVGIVQATVVAPPLSNDERESRRQAMIRAAQEREKSWDKKVGSAKSKRKVKNGLLDGICYYNGTNITEHARTIQNNLPQRCCFILSTQLTSLMNHLVNRTAKAVKST
jgi:hypothetical protein